MSLALVAAAALSAAPAPPQSCQAALMSLRDDQVSTALPGQVDGAALAGPAALAAIRSERGEALIVVNGGSFEGADMRRARLHNICFVETNLAGSNWSGADAPGIGFVGSDLRGADLRGARMPLVLFRNSQLDNLRGEGADLSGGRLDGGWFSGSIENVRLERANLTGFRFDCGITIDDGCPVYNGAEQIVLRGADLSGANLFTGSDISGARIDRTEVEPGELRDLRSARIEGPVILVGGDARVELSPEEVRSLLRSLDDPLRPDEPPASPSAPPAWARTGTLALFVDSPLLFQASFRSTPLYRKILPALIGASYSRAAVEVAADGSLAFDGEAIGANAHSCTLNGSGLRFDPATGWYSGAQEAQPDEPEAWRGRPMRVVQLDGERLFVNAGAGFAGGDGDDGRDPRPSEFVNCGMRAGFSPMVRVPVPEDEIRALIRAYRGEE